MATSKHSDVLALVYDYLSKTDVNLAQVFKKKTQAVSIILIIHIETHTYYCFYIRFFKFQISYPRVCCNFCFKQYFDHFKDVNPHVVFQPPLPEGSPTLSQVVRHFQRYVFVFCV